jgi:DNA-binding transcriptional LysR family regulator
MDLRSIRYFVAAAQQLNFGRAAEKMNVVQPAISRRIKHLEEELGILLFERVGNAVILTEAGRQLLPEYRKLLRLAGDCVRVAQHAGKGGDGIVRFAFVDNALSTLLPPLLREFRAQHPRVELELEALDRQSQIASLNDRTIDVGLLPEPICEDRFSYQRFVSAPLVVALPQGHRLAARASLRIAELEHEPFILLPAVLRTRIHETVISACAIAGFTPQVAEEANQIHTCLALVDAGVGITLLPSWAASKGVHDVVFRSLIDSTTNYALAFAWRRDAEVPALNGLLEVARSIAEEVGSVSSSAHMQRDDARGTGPQAFLFLRECACRVEAPRSGRKAGLASS